MDEEELFRFRRLSCPLTRNSARKVQSDAASWQKISTFCQETGAYKCLLFNRLAGTSVAVRPPEPSTRVEEDNVAKEDRGFASMDRAKQREIASKGGKAAHQKGTAHEWTSEEARDAGRKGGIASHRRRREQMGTSGSPDEVGSDGDRAVAMDRSDSYGGSSSSSFSSSWDRSSSPSSSSSSDYGSMPNRE